MKSLGKAFWSYINEGFIIHMYNLSFLFWLEIQISNVFKQTQFVNFYKFLFFIRIWNCGKFIVVQIKTDKCSHRFVRVHYDPSFMLSVGVGARGRRHRYTYGTSRIQPTVAKDTKVASRGWARTRRTARLASIWRTSARAIKDGTSARSSSSTGHPTVTRTVPGFI